MMNNEVFVKIVVLIFSILWTITTAYVLPAIRAKMTNTQLEQVRWYATMAVRCAEQIYTPEEWEQKKAYVMDRVLIFCVETLHLQIDRTDLDTIVEGIVNEVKHG